MRDPLPRIALVGTDQTQREPELGLCLRVQPMRIPRVRRRNARSGRRDSHLLLGRETRAAGATRFDIRERHSGVRGDPSDAAGILSPEALQQARSPVGRMPG
jgi:hypothetical protein